MTAATRLEPIGYATASTWLGQALVAQSELGICAILLGDDPEVLVSDLQRRFPRAVLTGANPACAQHIEPLVGSMDTGARPTSVSLDLRGTAFQQRVWRCLLGIPSGRTASYTDIALRVGSPRAVRAVAQACGANPVAVVVPCHRVVGKNGLLTGYRWGVDRKRALLEREAAQTHLTPSI